TCDASMGSLRVRWCSTEAWISLPVTFTGPRAATGRAGRRLVRNAARVAPTRAARAARRTGRMVAGLVWATGGSPCLRLLRLGGAGSEGSSEGDPDPAGTN